MHLPEIAVTIIMLLSGQKGFEFYKRKRYAHGGRDRRSISGSNSVHNSFAQSDKDFIASCFSNQTRESATNAKINRLELVTELGEIIRSEGDSTRETVRSMG